MAQDFDQIIWDQSLEMDCRRLVELARREDLGGQQDWTTAALVEQGRTGRAILVARQAGVVAGIAALATAIDALQADLTVTPSAADGDTISPGTALASLHGNVRDLLTSERILLNLTGRLMGIATLTRNYVTAVQGRGAVIYDTRKTTPGMRRLEKYAVRCGGARNHRTGLYDAVLIKDNHLAQMAAAGSAPEEAAATAVVKVRQFLDGPEHPASITKPIVEIEVDSLEQLEKVLPTGPDIILLDNMSPEMLRKAVAMRGDLAPEIQLEASGGVRLEIIGEIADTGVDRISVGALTHSAQSLDIGLDWD
jgi:nicotinate-nucleotide pyrophosphorylase (carboxylating)